MPGATAPRLGFQKTHDIVKYHLEIAIVPDAVKLMEEAANSPQGKEFAGFFEAICGKNYGNCKAAA